MARHLPAVALTLFLAATVAIAEPIREAGEAGDLGGETLFAEADDVFIRHWRWRVAPGDIGDFEALLRHCASAAMARGAGRSERWLYYREPPTHYWVVQIRSTREELRPQATLEDFVLTAIGDAGSEAEDEAKRLLADLDYQTEWVSIARQHLGWSTVDSMSTSTHPMARIVDFSIKPGKEKAFSLAMAARTKFLVEHEYALPIESFALAEGTPSHVWMVVFAPTWESLHESDSADEFASGLDPEAAEELAALDAALAETVSAVDFYDAMFAADLYPEAEPTVDEESNS